MSLPASSPSGTSHHIAPTNNTHSRSTSPTAGALQPDESGCRLDERYECPICIHYLNEPVLTTCGHRFCKSCILSWLQNQNQCCPLDSKKLSIEHDIFPDNFTRREIAQIKMKCPNSVNGCNFVASPIEVDRHALECPHSQRFPIPEKCPFAVVKCTFTATENGPTIEEHTRTNVDLHMNLMLDALQQHSLAQWTPPQKVSNGYANSNLPPPPAQYANEADENLIAAMSQRIVVLEQICRENEAKIEMLSKQKTLLTNSSQLVDPRYSNGVIVWEVANFTSVIDEIQKNINTHFYSRECYTSPYGYKFCARINVHRTKGLDLDHLSLHVHLMQSENDIHLDWPFNGRLKFCMVHPKKPELSQNDTIMSKSDFLAFHRPKEHISSRGFGFLEYARITDIFHKGFIDNDRLIIKIQVNIV